MRRKIEVTAEEMLSLRNEPYCLTNIEIAKRLDISLNTVLKYIGKQNGQPSRMQKHPDEKTVLAEAPKQERDGHVFTAAHSITVLESGSRQWFVDSYNQTVELSDPGTTWTASDVHAVLNELTYIQSVLNRAKEEGRVRK